jgi:hypothetical protein
MKGFASIGLVIVVAGCRGGIPPERSSNVAASSTTSGSITATHSVSADSLRDDLVEHGLRVPDGRREVVIANLGRPDSIRSHAEANPNDPTITDSVAYLFYPGLRLDYVVGAGNRGELLQLADVSNNRYLKYPALGVGASAAAVVSALGKPWQRTDDTYSYVCGRCIGPDNPVIFHLDGGRVRRVEYQFYAE